MKLRKLLSKSGSTLVESVVSMAIIGISAAMISVGIIAGMNFVSRGTELESKFNDSRIAIEQKIKNGNSGSKVTVKVNGIVINNESEKGRFEKITDNTAGIELVYYRYIPNISKN